MSVTNSAVHVLERTPKVYWRFQLQVPSSLSSLSQSITHSFQPTTGNGNNVAKSKVSPCALQILSSEVSSFLTRLSCTIHLRKPLSTPPHPSRKDSSQTITFLLPHTCLALYSSTLWTATGTATNSVFTCAFAWSTAARFFEAVFCATNSD